MLEAIFQEGILSLTLAGLTQWDYGQKLTIKGLTVSSALEVHFSNNAEKEAIVMSATKSGSDIITEIPNVLLEKDKDITAWVYTDDGQSGETIRTIVLKVTPRIKPADYISENNAGEVIDYVAKAEEYANSAQESAKSAQDNAEQVQVNTDIVKDLLANVPDFDSYEKLAEHNKLLYDGLYVKGETYSGIASNKGIKLHSVKGKTSQKTTNGYQLFDASKLPSKSGGGATVTNNNDGSFTISGSGNLTELYSNAYIYSNERFKNFIKKGQLKLNAGSSNPKVSITFYDDSVSPSKVYVDLEHDRSSGTITDEILNNSNIKMRIRFYGLQNSAIKTATIKPMLYQDGDGTWEQFTGGQPAPNPDYAMPIENVEISEITSHGRNLLPYPYYCGGIGVKNTQSGINFEILPDKSFKLSGTATSSCYINLARIDFGGDEFNVSHYVGLVGNTDDNIALFYNANNKITSIYISPNATVDTIVYPMISKGKQVPEWEAPTGYNTVETSLILAQDDIYQDGTITRARKQVTFDGSSDEAWTTTDDNLEDVLRFKILHGSKSVNYNGVCNRFPYEANYHANTEHFYCDLDSIVIFINKSRLSTQDVAGFKTWLSTHNTVVEYKLETPITEEYQVPTIPSYYPFTNVSTDNDLTTDITWKILADCDNSLYQEELEKRIQALEAQILGL